MAVQRWIGRMLWGKSGILTVSSYVILGLMDFFCREVILFLAGRKCLLWLNIWAISFWRGRKYEKCSLQEFAVFIALGIALRGISRGLFERNNNFIWMRHDRGRLNFDQNDDRSKCNFNLTTHRPFPCYMSTKSISSHVQLRLFSLHIPAMDFILWIIRSNS